MQIVLLGGARESVDQACTFLIEKISMDEMAPRKGDSLVVSLVMSRNCVSKIIGTKGATISELRKQCGCNISADMDNVKGEQLVHITGGPPELPYAMALLTPFVEESGDSPSLAFQEYSDAFPEQAGKGWPVGGDRCKGWAPAEGGCSKGWASDAGKGWKSDGYAKGWEGGGKAGKAFPADDGKAWAPKGKGKSRTSAALPGVGDDPPMETSELEIAHENQDILDFPTAIHLTIPSNAISRVLGKGGSSAEQIRQLAGVTLKIEPNGEEGIVRLTGSVLGVHHAHCMVIARVHSEY